MRSDFADHWCAPDRIRTSQSKTSLVAAWIAGVSDATLSLFSYGTLRQPDVQLTTFGRLLDGAEDAIVGFRLEWLTIVHATVIATSGSDRHPVLRTSGESDTAVEGTVFAITEQELAAVDEYEVDDYVRVLAPPRSGGEAWVYVAAADT